MKFRLKLTHLVQANSKEEAIRKVLAVSNHKAKFEKELAESISGKTGWKIVKAKHGIAVELPNRYIVEVNGGVASPIGFYLEKYATMDLMYDLDYDVEAGEKVPKEELDKLADKVIQLVQPVLGMPADTAGQLSLYLKDNDIKHNISEENGKYVVSLPNGYTIPVLNTTPAALKGLLKKAYLLSKKPVKKEISIVKKAIKKPSKVKFVIKLARGADEWKKWKKALTAFGNKHNISNLGESVFGDFKKFNIYNPVLVKDKDNQSWRGGFFNTETWNYVNFKLEKHDGGELLPTVDAFGLEAK